ncbi:MAG: hypothetical protein ACREYE_00585, partial [Gammaproteobacteria bacterium]
MTVRQWRLMGAHGLSAAFTVDAGYKAFVVSAFTLLEAQHQIDGRSAALYYGWCLTVALKILLESGGYKYFLALPLGAIG